MQPNTATAKIKDKTTKENYLSLKQNNRKETEGKKKQKKMKCSNNHCYIKLQGTTFLLRLLKDIKN